MCESNTAALCKSNGKDTIYKPLAAWQGRGTAWEQHGICELAFKKPNAAELHYVRDCKYDKASCNSSQTTPLTGREILKLLKFPRRQLIPVKRHIIDDVTARHFLRSVTPSPENTNKIMFHCPVHLLYPGNCGGLQVM
jgi:hypothetical protein